MSIDVDAPLIVIPDTHGHLAHVEALLGNLRERGYLVDHRLAFLGDYVDRGPQIRGLLDLCITLQREGHLFLMGNHEYTLIQALTPSDVQDAWISRWARNYESRTLWSYGLRTLKSIDVQRWKHVATAFRKKIPAEHWDFLAALPWMHETEEYIIVHAGLEPKVSWEEQRAQLLGRVPNGVRGPSQLFSTELGYAIEHPAPKILVTGHSVVSKPVATPTRRMIHCGVDIGGPLAAWVSDQKKYILVS